MTVLKKDMCVSCVSGKFNVRTKAIIITKRKNYKGAFI